MQEGQDTFDHEEEVKVWNANLENEEIKSNWHKKPYDPLDIVENMRSLKVDVRVLTPLTPQVDRKYDFLCNKGCH